MIRWYKARDTFLGLLETLRQAPFIHQVWVVTWWMMGYVVYCNLVIHGLAIHPVWVLLGLYGIGRDIAWFLVPIRTQRSVDRWVAYGMALLLGIHLIGSDYYWKLFNAGRDILIACALYGLGYLALRIRDSSLRSIAWNDAP